MLEKSPPWLGRQTSFDHWLYVFSFIYIDTVKSIYSMMLVSSIQYADSVIHTHTFFFKIFSLIGYYKILSIVPCAI